jgi:RNA polymerase sigma-70 factor (ECF subfamily)
MDQFEDLRPYLFSVAYRMVGRASIAEDLVQDTYLRYLQTQPEQIKSLKAFLTTIIVRLSLNYLQSAQHEREQYYGIWLPEPMMTSSRDVADHVEEDETLSLAFLYILEKLSPPERAVFVLHEVLDYPFADIASMIEKTASTCRQLFLRARKHLTASKQRFSVSADQTTRLVHQFVNAIRSGNVSSLTSVLAQDAISWADGGGKVQAARYPLNGNERIAQAYIAIFRKFATPTMRIHEGIVNGMPAIFSIDQGKLIGVWLLGMSPQAIDEIFIVINPDKLRYMEKQLQQGILPGVLL